MSRGGSHADSNNNNNSDSDDRRSNSNSSGASSPSEVARSQPQERRPAWRIDTFLFLCHCLSMLTVASATLCMILNSISVYRSFRHPRQDIFVTVLRCYAVAIAGFVAVAESEWEAIFKLWGILEFWVGRGMLQIFVAVMTKALAHASGESKIEVTLHVGASWVLLGCGAFYTSSGLLCFGRLKNWRLKRMQRRESALRDLEEVERRRRELHGLLALDP